MKKSKFLDVAFSLALLNFGGVFASDQMDQQNGDWVRLTNVQHVNGKTAQKIKAFCEELPLDPDDFLSLLNSVRANPSASDPKDCDLFQQGLIKFYPDISKSKIETIIKTPIAKLSQNFLKDPIKNAETLAKEEANQRKLITRSPKASGSRNVLNETEIETFLRESAKENGCCLADRKIMNTLKSISKLKKIHDDIVELILRKNSYEQTLFLNRKKELKDQLYKILIEHRELATTLTELYRSTYYYLKNMLKEYRLVFCEVSERYIHEYLEKQKSNTLKKYTWVNLTETGESYETTVFYNDTGLLLTRDLLDTVFPVFSIDRNLNCTLLKTMTDDEYLNELLAKRCYSEAYLKLGDNILVNVELLNTRDSEIIGATTDRISSLFQDLQTPEGQDRLVDHTNRDITNDSTTVYLKDGSMLKITAKPGGDLIILGDPEAEDNWWDLLDTDFEFIDNTSEYNISLILNNSTHVLYKGHLPKEEYFELLETIRTNNDSDDLIENVEVFDGSEAIIHLKDNQKIKLMSLFAEIKITLDNWKLLLGKEKFSTETITIM